MGFIIASNVFTWSHAKTVLSHNDKVYLRNILVNPNIIAIFVSVILQLMKVRLPEMIEGAVESLGNMIILPLICLPVLKYSGLSSLADNGKTVLMITFLGVCSPPASSLSQLALVHGEDSRYISSITIISTLLCIITMPLMVMLFQL